MMTKNRASKRPRDNRSGGYSGLGVAMGRRLRLASAFHNDGRSFAEKCVLSRSREVEGWSQVGNRNAREGRSEVGREPGRVWLVGAGTWRRGFVEQAHACNHTWTLW